MNDWINACCIHRAQQRARGRKKVQARDVEKASRVQETSKETEKSQQSARDHAQQQLKRWQETTCSIFFTKVLAFATQG